jgi:hypothetical protein
MDHIPVKSSHLTSVAWEEGTLEVEFSNGARYRYDGVPERVYVELVNAASPGKYFQNNVLGTFEHRRM